MKSIKKLFICLMIFSVSFILISCNNDDFTFNEKDFEFEYSDEKVAVLTGYKGHDKKVIIPKDIKKDNINYKIISIGEDAFARSPSLTSITIPNGITSIGDRAFRGCLSLTINCEADKKPSGWDIDWNPNKRPVNWGYKK